MTFTRHMFRAALVVSVLSGVFAVTLPHASAAAQGQDALGAAMEVMRDGDWDEARRLARDGGQITQDIIDWHWHRSGRGTFEEVRGFLERRGDWPGLPLLRRRTEDAIALRANPEAVIAHFAEAPPQTGAGHIIFARAQLGLGNQAAAEALLITAWREYPLSAADETYVLGRHAALLKPHHEARLDRLLWRDDEAGVRRMLPRVSTGWRNLAEARLALRKTLPGVDGLIEKVPAALADDPGLAFERFYWRFRKGRNASAAELALSRSPDELGRPSEWANMRRILARWAMREGQTETAYNLASAHGLSSGSHFADLEWLSGYLALRVLDRPEAALAHFQTFGAGVRSPISLGRAKYWEGRAFEALGREAEALDAFRAGGRYQTSFYGMLSAERAGMAMDPNLAQTNAYPDWASAEFASSTVFEAAFLLYNAGERVLAERFLVHLTESLDATEIGQLADFAFSIEEPHIALMIAKQAARQGVIVPHAYFPVVDLGLSETDVPQELALAIARRESEFDPSVTSGAGALGLMQVMPATAQEVAGWIGEEYDRARMLDDPAYNARLGVTYLGELTAILGGNNALIAAGYNAGPGRPIRWIDRNGDPREDDVDAVDWVEQIPFRETRNYVMRVMESLPIYRARLAGEVVELRLSEELKAR